MSAVLCGATALSTAGQTPATSPAATAAGDRTVYSHDFSTLPGDEWTRSEVDADVEYVEPGGNLDHDRISIHDDPAVERTMLGRFSTDRVLLSLADLPAHRAVRVEFDLLTLRSWDGSHRTWGPDIWHLAVVDGPTLIRSTFSTSVNHPPCNQCYPDDCPFGDYNGGTGAAEQLRSADQAPVFIYRLQVVFPHSGRELTLEFADEGLQGVLDEGWGLDNVRVSVLPRQRGGEPSEAVLREAIDRLAGRDPVVAREALWELVAAGEPAGRLLRDTVGSFLPTEQQETEVRRLIEQLGADEWEQRQQATDRLVEMGAVGSFQIRTAVEQASSAEQRVRLRDVLEQIESRPNRRPFLPRATRALTLIPGPEAEQALRRIRRYGPTAALRGLAEEGLAHRPWLEKQMQPATRPAE
jgi:hypothetical protein